LRPGKAQVPTVDTLSAFGQFPPTSGFQPRSAAVASVRYRARPTTPPTTPRRRAGAYLTMGILRRA